MIIANETANKLKTLYYDAISTFLTNQYMFVAGTNNRQKHEASSRTMQNKINKERLKISIFIILIHSTTMVISFKYFDDIVTEFVINNSVKYFVLFKWREASSNWLLNCRNEIECTRLVPGNLSVRLTALTQASEAMSPQLDHVKCLTYGCNNSGRLSTDV